MAELMARQSSQFQPLKRGDMVTGTVKKLTPKEILLDIGYKSDALVIEYDKQNLENLLGLLKVGDTVKASVISPESEEGFPVLSLRRMLEEKVYGALETVFKADTTLKANILEVTRGGYFIEIDGGIKGFLPNSQFMDGKLNQGDTVDVKVIEFDREKKRVIVSQKATHYLMNIAEIEKVIKRDSVIKGTVTLVTPYGVYLEISPKDDVLIEGFVHISEVSHQRVEGLEGKFTIGDKIDVQVIGVDVENKRVNLSIKRVDILASLSYWVKQRRRNRLKNRGLVAHWVEGLKKRRLEIPCGDTSLLLVHHRVHNAHAKHDWNVQAVRKRNCNRMTRNRDNQIRRLQVLRKLIVIVLAVVVVISGSSANKRLRHPDTGKHQSKVSSSGVPVS
jgi:predicted RNA-binding protein with RPS1 domain